MVLPENENEVHMQFGWRERDVRRAEESGGERRDERGA
jgi:hypothetical protein